ncbi:MAG: hypothetical protein LBU83_11185 [Bacteroidales bacterium]|jgi:hypothetical protein|nr:hypothetical protein [Bacteroidales bacterium]
MIDLSRLNGREGAKDLVKSGDSRYHSLNGAKPESHTRGNNLKLSTMKNFLLILVCLIGFKIGSNAQDISSCGLSIACGDYKKILTYSEAVSNCPAGYRLPTIEELECMAKNKSALKLSLWGEYWSVTTKGEKAYSVTMDDGKREECGKHEKKRVRYIKDANDQSDASETQDCSSTTDQSGEKYALIYIYRPAIFFGSGASYNIDVEDKINVWKCKNGKGTIIKITKESPITLHAKTEAHAFLTFDVEFGKEYYVECTIRMGAFVGQPQIKLKDETEGRSEFNKIKSDK